ncbi:MAG: hypothetical protein H6747_04485 [Deltaproteobacteria bacterium]|nr:hypothetical protein [Deltaproteobacteria bacterium]
MNAMLLRNPLLLAMSLLLLSACSGESNGGAQPILFPDGFGGGGNVLPTGDTSGGGGGAEDSSTGGGGDDVAAAGDTGGGGEDTATAGDTATGGEDAAATADAGGGSEDVAGGEDTAGGQDTTTGEDTSVGEDTAPTGDASGQDSGGTACVDVDQDGYGNGCSQGPDCDDSNPNFALVCPDCSKANHPGCACTVAAANCYSGDPQWIGKGVCIAGVQLCKNGFWGTCEGEVLPQPESCDNKDNNCNGLIDEGVLSTCGTCDMSCTQQTMGPDFGNPFDPGKDSSNGVGVDGQGYIVLDKSKANFDLNHIWIANSGQATVSKLDTKTGAEVARYNVCGNPSRTSVDLNGDVWVGCRQGGGVMKIIAKEANCIDKNGNGTIETSKDLDGNKQISGNEMLANGQDECIRFEVKPNNSESIIRAAGVDKDNHVWVGGWNTKQLYRLHPDTGAVVDTVSLGCPPYGLTIDQKGIIWVQCTSGGLKRVDPLTKQMQSFPYKAGAYGINVDMFGRIWVASGANASRFDPTTGQWDLVPGINQVGGSGGGGRGVATSNDGNVYVAVDGGHKVVKINAVTLAIEGAISLGGGRYPVGMAVDFDGYVWAVNQSAGSATKIDPKANAVIGEYKVGSGPYTYSDMTGYTLHNYTAPKGHYTHTFGFAGYSGTVAEAKTKTVWENIDVQAEIPAKALLKVRWRVGENLKDIETKAWSKEYGPFPPALFPIDLTMEAQPVEGRFLQVEVFLQAGSNKLSPILKSLKAKGKQIPVL